TMDISNLKVGIYFLKIHGNGGEIITKKVIKK
ncbi:MAG: T9SS type A sorting domain-containing protein, partial [Algicola sp.]|nr:T9SS type A sorting domain-containing protein [Algicola sp.]